MRLLNILKQQGLIMILIKTILIILLAAISLGILDILGIAPLTAAILLIFFGNLLKILFKIICFIVSTGLLIWLLTAII